MFKRRETNPDAVTTREIVGLYTLEQVTLARKAHAANQIGDIARRDLLLDHARIGMRDVIFIVDRVRPIFTPEQVAAGRAAMVHLDVKDFDAAEAILDPLGVDANDLGLMQRLGFLDGALPAEEESDEEPLPAAQDVEPVGGHDDEPAPSASASPTTVPGRTTPGGLAVELPDGTDLTDPHLRARVEARVRSAYGENHIPLWPFGKDPVDGVAAVIPIIDARPGARTVTLGDDAGPSAAARVAQVGREKGLGDLVAYNAYGRTATFAHLPAATKQLRSAVCRELGVKEPWEVELLVDSEMVIVLRSPALSSDEKRVERWTDLARILLPANAGQKWVVEDDAATKRIYLRRIEDRLREVQSYDWDAPVDLHHLPFGVREDGSPLSLGLLEVNMLLGGTPGGGKSGGLTTLLCGIARLEHVALIGLDPKRVEQEPWKTRFSVIAKDEDFATDVLEAMRDEMERRYHWLEGTGLKKFGPAQFSDERPLLVLVIDELADLVSVGATREEKDAEAMRSTLIRRLIAKGRAAGIVVIAATQKPQADVIPTSLRDLIQMRICYATTNSDMTDTVLGKGMAQNGGEAHSISAKERGVCFVVNETSRTPRRARTYWVPDEEVRGISERYAHLRVDLPWMAEQGPKQPSSPQPKPAAAPAAAVTDLGEIALSLDDLIEFEDDEPVGEIEVPKSRWEA